MKANVGAWDRALRIAGGVALLGWMLLVDGDLRWWGAFGVIPLATGIIGFCPLYRLTGLSTCPLARASR